MKTATPQKHIVKWVANAIWTVSMLGLLIVSIPTIFTLWVADFVSELDYVFVRLGGRI